MSNPFISDTHQGEEPSPVTTVHLVFKTHLDIGFTNLATTVMDNYIEHYIPTAINLARTMREEGGNDRFTWTVGSLLIYEYLERKSGKLRQQMEEAINLGDINWHALPMTTHTELMDSSLFNFGLSLSQELDRRFGKVTISAKLTDVPGHTRAMAPLLALAGVEFLHIGVNPACPVPEVPELFQWRDEASDTGITVMYNRDYGTPTVVSGIGEALCVTSTGDNHGPHSIDAIKTVFEDYRLKYPGANIVASSLDNFARSLRKLRNNLPIVTSEIGDTWIHGAASDPTKVADYRELCRMRRQWITNKEATVDSLNAFSRKLIMVPEHTWGLDVKSYTSDFETYKTEDFAKARETFEVLEQSWREQRAYVTEAVKALPTADLARQATTALAGLRPTATPGMNESNVTPDILKLETLRFALELDRHTGAIIRLYDKHSDSEWANSRCPLGLLTYQVLGSNDYDRFANQYIREWALQGDLNWAITDLTRPGLEHVLTEGQRWSPSLCGVKQVSGDFGPRYMAELDFPQECVQRFGAPSRVVVELGESPEGDGLDVVLQWFGKQACRIAEGLWYSMVPVVSDYGRWTLNKMDRPVLAHDVVSKGNRKLHAITDTVSYTRRDARFTVRSWDAPVVAVGQPTLLDFDDRIPNATDGVHFNLYNNVWGTNFRMWFEDDAKFRFRIEL